jgi:hypothetical protein
MKLPMILRTGLSITFQNLTQETSVQVGNVDEAPAEVRGREPDVRFEEVQDTEDVPH